MFPVSGYQGICSWSWLVRSFRNSLDGTTPPNHCFFNAQSHPLRDHLGFRPPLTAVICYLNRAGQFYEMPSSPLASNHLPLMGVGMSGLLC